MIKAIVDNSKVISLLKKIILTIVLSYRGTFLYKMFMKDDKGSFNNSFLYSFFEFFNTIVKNINKFILSLNLFPYLKPKLKLSDALNNSKILKLFQVPKLNYNIQFAIFVITIFLAALIPTMAVVVLVVLVFFSIITDRKLKIPKPVFTDALIGLYLVNLIYGYAISSSPDRLNILLVDFVFVAFYYAVRNIVVSKEKIINTVAFFSFSGFLVCIIAFLQYVLGVDSTQSWTDSDMFKDIGLRVYSTFQNPNVLGEYLLFLIPLTFAMVLISKKIFHKIIFGGIFFCSLMTIILTYSRGCWIGLIIGIIFFLAMLYNKILVAGIFASPFSILVLPQSIINRFASIGNMNDSSTSYRVSIWNSTYSMLKTHWISGVGIGAEAYARTTVPFSHSGVFAQHAHNSYLHIFSETGLFGILTFSVLVFWILRQLFLAYKNSADKPIKIIAVSIISGLIGLLIQGFFDNTFYNYRMYLIFFIMLALSSAISEVVKCKEDGV